MQYISRKLLVPTLLLAFLVLNFLRNSPRIEDDRAQPSSNSPSHSLLSQEAIQEQGARLARVYSIKPASTWCTNATNSDFRYKGKYADKPMPPFCGILFVKVPKAASSTIASIVHRISRQHHNCTFRNDHDMGTRYVNRNVTNSFLLGSIRDPAARAISRVFFHHVSRHDMKPTNENVLKALKTTNNQFGAVSEGRGGFQLTYLTTTPIEVNSAWKRTQPTRVRQQEQVIENVNKTLNDYDFILVVERMDESLVVMSMLMRGVTLGDLLTMDSKAQGSYMFHYARNECFQIKKANTSNAVKKYLESDTWFAQNYGDYVLRAAANASLDKTINMLGRTRVKQAVDAYRRLKTLVHETCASEAIFPCSLDGKNQFEASVKNCYKKDQGCGFACIDKVVKRHGTIK